MNLDLDPKEWKSEPRPHEPFWGPNGAKRLLIFLAFIVVVAVVKHAYRNWPNWP